MTQPIPVLEFSSERIEFGDTGAMVRKLFDFQSKLEAWSQAANAFAFGANATAGLSLNGGTLGGNLTIESTAPRLNLDNSADPNRNAHVGFFGGNLEFRLQIGDQIDTALTLMDESARVNKSLAITGDVTAAGNGVFQGLVSVDGNGAVGGAIALTEADPNGSSSTIVSGSAALSSTWEMILPSGPGALGQTLQVVAVSGNTCTLGWV